MKLQKMEPDKRRITGLYTLAALRRRGFRLARSFAYGSFPRQPTPTFFCARETLRVSLIGRKKTSHTTGTLCAIGLKNVFFNKITFYFFIKKIFKKSKKTI
jgi:hypothetical protein